uniref:Uncharacterized protein n=1 Tax=Peronospora matthiolae TaxID=2874970 RepID=A0AAV1TGQ9_9STRA
MKGQLPASREPEAVVQTNKAQAAALADCGEVKSSSREDWRLVKGGLVRLLDICVEIATAYPNSSTVKSDFSIMKLDKNDTRLSLTDSLLDGSMQCQELK